LKSGNLSGFAQGKYVFHTPKPVSALVTFDEAPPAFVAATEPSDFDGTLRSQLDLAGTLYSILLGGSIHGNRVAIHSDHIQLLGGNWSISGYWPVQNSLIRLDDVEVHDLNLTKATQRNDIAGTVNGKCWVDVRSFSLDDLYIYGEATVNNLKIGDPSANSGAVFIADKIDLPRIRVDGDYVSIDDIAMAHTDSGTDGSVKMRMITTLRHPTRLWTGVELTNWPVHPISGELMVVNANGYADLDLQLLSAIGHLDLSTNSSASAGHLTDWRTAIDLNGRSISANEIIGHPLGGFAVGVANIDLDHPAQSLAWMSASGLDISQLARLDPGLSNTGGKVDASFRLEPAETPHPLEATSWSLTVHPDDLKVSNISVGDLVMHGFVGRDRCVLDNSRDRASYLDFAGGKIYLWGRVSEHSGQIYQSLLNLNLQNLDLNQLVHADPKAKKTPGLIGGQVAIIGWPRHASELFGSGHLTIDKSDLGGFAPIADLYNLMHLGHNANKPTGSGSVDFTLQNDTLTVTGLRYFDKGTEILAEFSIANLVNIPDSPLAGTVVGSFRPLRAIDLPVIGDIDSALNALQQNSQSIRIYGTVRQPKDRPILFGEIGNDMLNFLLGDTREEHGE
jgi:hypothetical protein